jgi:tetratricopeptide (TPR) repeat protein
VGDSVVPTRRAAAVVLTIRPNRAVEARFVGRADELGALLDVLQPWPDPTPVAPDGSDEHDGDDGYRPVAVSVAGAPGVGKSALAERAAQQAVVQGWFPGGAVSVDLRGYDPDPAEVVWPAQVFGAFLRALGMPSEQIPATESEQATAYHQLLNQLAAAGRAVLVVLDNASDPGQIIDLLPHDRIHRVLVTSRETLAELPDAQPLDLEVLMPTEAVELLTVGLRRRRAYDRVAEAPEVAAALASMCGYLPLALQIVVALLADEPNRPLAELVAELKDERTRLQALAYDDRWTVQAAFDLSYHRLAPKLRRLLSLLAAVPGPDIGLELAAAVAGEHAAKTRTALMRLTHAHLMEQHRPGRWRMHDLIRLYAQEQLTAEERDQNLVRVIEWCRNATLKAAARFTTRSGDIIDPHYNVFAAELTSWQQHQAVLSAIIHARQGVARSEPTDELVFMTRDAAMMWFLRERATLMAVITNAISVRPRDVTLLSWALAPFMKRFRYLQDWVISESAGIQASQVSGERRDESGASDRLGLALQELRRFDEAMAAHKRALELARALGDRHGEARALNNRGLALWQLGRVDEAVVDHDRAIRLFRKLEDTRGEGEAQNNLGGALQQKGQLDEAVIAHERAAKLFKNSGDKYGEGQATNNLGGVLQQQGRLDDAIAQHERAATLFEEDGNEYAVARAWTNLGGALIRANRPDDAVAVLERAVTTSQRLGERHVESTALTNLSVALLQLAREDEVVERLMWAANTLKEVGDLPGEGLARTHLGEALFELGRFDEARDAWSAALDIVVAQGSFTEADLLRRSLKRLGDGR